MTLVEKVNELLSDDACSDEFEQNKRNVLKGYYNTFLQSSIVEDLPFNEKKIHLFIDQLMQHLIEHMKNIGYEEFTQEFNYYIFDDLVKAGFDNRFNEKLINELLSMGINPGNTPINKQQLLYRHLSILELKVNKDNTIVGKQQMFIRQISILEQLKRYISMKFKDCDPKLKFAGSGLQSIILQYNRLIDFAGNTQIYEPILYKIVDDAANEVRLSLLLKDNTRGYIATANHIGYNILELPKIAGESFEKHLKYNSPMADCNDFSAADNALTVVRSIFKGLVVLRKYNIFHRDLWLGNIISELIPPHLITNIIDLGIATDVPNSEPKDNRRYGGANDIISLGQLSYKIYTGKNLFNTSITESTWTVADNVKIYREQCYQTPELLAKRLEQVDEEMNDKTNQGLKEIIITCLQATELDQNNSSFAHPNTYNKLKELFDKYTNKRMISIEDIAEEWNL